VAIERNRRFSREVFSPTSNTELQADDILLVDIFVPDVPVETLREKYALEALPLSGDYFTDRSQEIGMAEVMLGANSDLVGKTVVESRFRTRYGLTVIGLRRGSAAEEGSLLKEKLNVGDTLLVIGPWKDIRALQMDRANLVVLNLPAEMDQVLPASGKAPQAVACLLLMVGLMISGVVPNVQAALIACLLMGALRCIDFESAYRSIHWKSLVLIVGMLPFSLALQRTGGVDLAADALMSVTGGAGTPVVLGSIFLITATAGSIHFEHRHRGPDGTRRGRDRQRHERVALPLRHDRGAGRLDGVHDADLVAGEYAGGRSRQLQVWRLREDWGAVQPGGDGRLRHPRAHSAAALQVAPLRHQRLLARRKYDPTRPICRRQAPNFSVSHR
jgi:hypothetical protein